MLLFYTVLIIISILILIALNLVVFPYILYRGYLKYGKGAFYPLVGFVYYFNKNIEKHKDALHFIKHLRDTDNKSRTFALNLQNKVMVLLLHPELFRHFAQKEQEYYFIKNDYITDCYKRLMGDGIFFQEGQAWKKSRIALSHIFHHDELMNKVPLIEKITKQIFSKLINESKQNPDVLKKQDLISLFSEISAKVTVQTMLSTNFDDLRLDGMHLEQILAYLGMELGKRLYGYNYLFFRNKLHLMGLNEEDRKLNRQLKQFREMIKEKVIERIKEEEAAEQQGVPTNKYDIIYYLRKSNQLQEFTLDNIVDQFITFYLGGMDTSSRLTGMCAYYLTQDQDVKQKFVNEILQNNDHSYKALHNLSYLNGSIKETLRYYGPINTVVQRIALKDHFLDDVFIKKGTIVETQWHAVHRDSKYYDNPHYFNPQRWIDKPNTKPFTFNPFGIGPKNCIGQHLGFIQSRIILYYFTKLFDFECDEGYELIFLFRFMYEPQHHLRINLKVRDNYQEFL